MRNKTLMDIFHWGVWKSKKAYSQKHPQGRCTENKRATPRTHGVAKDFHGLWEMSKTIVSQFTMRQW